MMLHTDILCVGRIKEAFLKEALAEYEKRLGAYMKLRIIEVKDEPAPERISGADKERILAAESERLAAHIDERAALVALAIEGKEYDSVGLAEFIEKQTARGDGHIQFLIGGSLGLANELKNRAECISFSRLTFPHQLMRLILLEQLYRSEKILRGEPYHK